MESVSDYKNKYLIKMFKDFAEELGKTPTQSEILKRREIDTTFLTISLIRKRFGSLSKLVEICGLKSNYLILTNDELIKSLKVFYDKHGFIPSKKQFIKYANELPPIHLYDIKFHGIIKAMGIAKIPLSKSRTEIKDRAINDRSEKEMIDTFKDFYNKNGFVPKIKELESYNLPKISAITHKFNTYKNFVKCAGIDIDNEVRFAYKKYRTDEELLVILKDYSINIGFPTIRQFNTSNNLPSYTLYYDRFGSFKNAILLSDIEIPPEENIILIGKVYLIKKCWHY